MVFNVYFDPGVIDVATKGGEFGIATLRSVVQGMLTNCLLFDFEDARTQTEMGQKLDSAPSNFDLSTLKRLLAVLAKRNRIIFVIPADYYSTESDLDQALAAARNIPLDLALTNGIPSVSVPSCTVVTTLENYASCRFESERSARAAHGMVFGGGEYQAQSFLDVTLGKALRHASRIEICDRLLGQKFGDNFEHTIKQLFTWLERHHFDPSRCVINVHCGKTHGRDYHFLQRLAAIRTGRISSMAINVNFYENPTGDTCLPHQRYIHTDQFAFSIDRGMDFLDRATGNNRDASIDLKDEIEVSQKVGRYAAFRVASQTI